MCKFSLNGSFVTSKFSKWQTSYLFNQNSLISPGFFIDLYTILTIYSIIIEKILIENFRFEKIICI